MDAQNFLTMSMDELANEIAETKKKLSALEQLMKIRQQLGEKTTRQIEAKRKAEKRAEKKAAIKKNISNINDIPKDNETIYTTEVKGEPELSFGQDFFGESEEF